MSSTKPWALGLHIKPELVSLWEKSLPAGQSLLLWCLGTGKLSSSDYLNWAKDHYGIPLLNANYFDQKIDFNFWNQVKTVANWSNELMPVAFWDGIMFVACVEPLPEVKWSIKTQYLLADPDHLKKRWQSLNGQSDVAPTTDAPPSFEMPVGLSRFNIENSLSKQENFQSAPALPEAPPPLKETSTLVFDFSNLKIAKNETPAETLKQQTFTSIDQLPPIPKSSETLSEAYPSSPSIKVLKDLDGPTGPISPNTNDVLHSIGSPLSTHNVDQTVPTPLPTMNKSPMTNTLSAAESASNNEAQSTARTETEKAYIRFLPNLKIHFKGGMVIEIQSTGFKVAVWSEIFQPASPKSRGPWSLEVASAFRIAYRTRLPYLGHIPATAINKEFFAEWGYPDLPSAILIQPVVQNAVVTHLIMCLPETNKKNHSILTDGTQLAKEFVEIVNAKKSAA